MSNKVKAYLVCTVAIGIVVFTEAALHWACNSPWRLAIYLLLAGWAGSLKVRLPGITGTYSLNFIFVLIGIVDLSFGETILIATLSMIVQCLWRPKKPPMWQQVVFNANAVAIGAAIAFVAGRAIPAPTPIQLAAAAATYYLANTAVVSGILKLVEDKPFRVVWSRWFKWSFSYYVMGVCLVGAVTFFNQRFGWPYPLIFLPLMYLEYFYLRADLDYQELSGASC